MAAKQLASRTLAIADRLALPDVGQKYGQPHLATFKLSFVKQSGT